MTAEQRKYLETFHNNLREKPLEQGDPRYVPLWADEALIDSDPVELMLRSIEWTPEESVQLFAGFRGAGKTTELHRLAASLRDRGYIVVLSDVEKYLNMSTPIDISDFLIAIAGAFGDGLKEAELLDGPLHEGYWTRITNFLQSKVTFSEFGFDVGGIDIKANLKTDPTFRQKLQERMAGHLGALVADVHAFFIDCVKRLRDGHGEHKQVVFLVDSVEHIRGTSVNAEDVQASVEQLFTSHADQLQIPFVHVIYTVHPYLKVRYGNLGALYEPGGVKVLPSVKVRTKETRKPDLDGINALRRIVDKRGEWQQLLGDASVLDQVILASGGHLRDLVRILREIVLRAKTLPVAAETISAAMNQIRNEALPIADADAVWLNRIAESHSASLATADALTDFARFLDTHMVLCYWNGHEWYDVHPLIRDAVQEQAVACIAAGDQAS